MSMHTRSSYMPGIPLELLVERSRVMVLIGLEILGGAWGSSYERGACGTEAASSSTGPR